MSFDNIPESNVSAGKTISFTVDGVRAPPSLTPVTGFSFKTLSEDGFVIDQTDSATTISLAATQAQTGISQNMIVTSDDPSINEPSTLEFRV